MDGKMSMADGMHPLLKAMMAGGVKPQYMQGAMAAKDPKLGQALMGTQKEVPEQKQMQVKAEADVAAEADAQQPVQRDWSGFSALGQSLQGPSAPGAPGVQGPGGISPQFTQTLLQALMTGQPSQSPTLAQLLGGM